MIVDLPAHNCVAWTASYHFHSDEIFNRNIAILRSKRINVRVTIVVTPENHKQAFDKIMEYKNYGIGVNVHPVLKQDFDWAEHKDIWSNIQTLADGNRVMVIGDISDKWEAQHHDMCAAGGNYFALMPDGKVNRCYSQILTDETAGHISEYAPLQGKQPCSMDCMFPCDRQVANVK
jgi:hypothetical protein